MKSPIRPIRRHLERARGSERFVQLLVGGGLTLVAGLWIVTLGTSWSEPCLLGVALVLLGVGGLAAGIWTEIEY